MNVKWLYEDCQLFGFLFFIGVVLIVTAPLDLLRMALNIKRGQSWAHFED